MCHDRTCKSTSVVALVFAMVIGAAFFRHEDRDFQSVLPTIELSGSNVPSVPTTTVAHTSTAKQGCARPYPTKSATKAFMSPEAVVELAHIAVIEIRDLKLLRTQRRNVTLIFLNDKLITDDVMLQLAVLPFPFVLLTSSHQDYCVPFRSFPNGGDAKVEERFLTSAWSSKLHNNTHFRGWWAKNMCFKHERYHGLPLGPKFQTTSTKFWGEGYDGKTAAWLGALNGSCTSEWFWNTTKRKKWIFIGFSVRNTRFYRPLMTTRKRCAKELGSRFPVGKAKSMSEYYRQLKEHRFVASPAGRGLDTHRSWEALIMGSIPVVDDVPSLRELFADLPVLPVKSWRNVRGPQQP